MMSETVIAFVNDWRLGHIATTGPEGPNVSPKGTFQALDAARLAFAEIRSPQTRSNLAHDPRVEVNMVDVFARKGARFRGAAAYHGPGTAAFAELEPQWRALFGDALAAMFQGFVVIELASVKPLSTPLYDLGESERRLREIYLERFTAMQKDILES